MQTLREQVRLLRTQRQRSVVLAHLPPLRPEAQPPLNGALAKCTALDVARRLQLEPAQTPKVSDSTLDSCTTFVACQHSHHRWYDSSSVLLHSIS